MKHQSKNRRKHYRAISLLLCTSLLFSQTGFASYGDEVTEIEEEDPLEHVHTKDCYTGELICGFDQITVATGSDAGHVHTDECYELSCGYEQFEDEEELENDLPDEEPDGLLEDDILSDDLLNDDLLGNDLTEDQLNHDNRTETITEKDTQTKTEKIILITEFKELGEDIQYRNVETWTGMDELNLPESLEAMASFSDEEPEPVVINNITWKLDGDDGELAKGEEEINGSFTFTAVLPEHYSIDSGVEAPEIYVQVGNADRQLYAEVEYYQNDLTAFRALLDAHPSLKNEADPDDPATWAGNGFNGIVEWEYGTPKRIRKLNLYDKQLDGELNVSGFDYLYYLNCSDNNLTSLIVNNPRINTIYCTNNLIDKLSLSSPNGTLRYLYCSNNQLNSLDTRTLQLEDLECANNNISSLNINTSIKQLDCSNNKLSSLNARIYTNLTKLNCSYNDLNELDVYGVNGLKNINCSDNKINSLRLPNGLTVTHTSSENGTSQVTSAKIYDAQWNITLKAVPNENYCFSYWDSNALSEQEKVSNPLTFIITSNVAISPVFAEDNALQNAKSKIEGHTSYTVSQSTANTQDAVKTWLAEQINGITGMSDTGITVTADNITISSLTPAIAGNADSASGTNGGFSFTVTLASNGSNDTTKSINGVITATAFSGQTNAQIIAAAKSAIESGNYFIDQADANTQDGIKNILVNKINSLAALSTSGISVAGSDITVTSFTAAKNGNADTPTGVNGSFSFTVSLQKGASSAVTSSISGTITAADFTGQTNAELVAAAKAAIEGTAYAVSQTDANTQTEVKTWLVQTINALPGYSDTGIAVTAENINISSFNTATAGDEDNHNGSNGTFTFQVTLQKGAVQNITTSITGIITAQQYVPSGNPDDNKPDDSKPDDNKPDNNKPDNKPDDNKPDNNKPDNNKPDNNKPDNNKPDNNKPDNNNPAPDNSGSSNGNNSYGSDDSDSGSYYDTPSLTTESTPVTAEILVGQPDHAGNIIITADQIKDALNAARREARQKKTLGGGVSLTVRLPEGITQASINPDGLGHLSASDVTSVCFDYKGVSFTFYQDTIATMNGLAADSIIFAAKPFSSLTGEALTAINTYPVYELNAVYMKNGILMPLTSVGSINAAIAYTPGTSEDISALYAVSVDNLGNAHRIPDSKYNPSNSAVCFTINNFSTIGISSTK